MGRLRRLALRLANLVAPGEADRELDRELRSHLAMLEDEYLRRGFTAGDARRSARLALGGVDRISELHRDARSIRWLEDARRDCGYALRMLRRAPVVTATAALSLALGIGACTAVFSVAEALLLQPLPGVVHAADLVDITVNREDGGRRPLSFPAYEAVRDRVHGVEGVYARNMIAEQVAIARSADELSGHARAEFVTLNYFDVLGARPALGRLFTAAVEEPGGVLVLGHRFWTTRLHGRPDVIGQDVTLNGRPFVVLGVAPPAFRGTSPSAPDLWIPLSRQREVTGRTPAVFQDWATGWLAVGARLKPGVTTEAASAEAAALSRALSVEHPADGGRVFRVLPSSAVPANRNGTVTFVALLTGVVLTVLLVTCANVSGVLTARGLSRGREMAVRLSLGAHRGRLVRQLLTETLVLYAAGGGLGWMVALGIVELAGRWVATSPFAPAASVSLDGRVAACSALMTLLSAVLGGLAPALRASAAQPLGAMKGDATEGGGGRTVRGALLGAHVALTVALVAGGMLFARALSRAGGADPGFQVSGIDVTTVETAMIGGGDSTREFWTRVLGRVRSLPGVEDAALARVVPGGLEILGLGVSVPGPRPAGPDDFEPDGNTVSPHFFSTLGIPLVAGRDFDERDRAGSEPVAIVGEAAARRFWPGAPAVGQYLSRPVIGTERLHRVVGVVRDVRMTTLVDGMSSSFVYLPIEQAEPPLVARLTLITRTAAGRSAAAQIREAMKAEDPRLPAPTSGTLAESIAGGLALQRVASAVAGAMGLVGVLLAAVGLYGATALIVTRRLRELGIRIALGAGRREVVRIALGHAMAIVLGGCVAGAGLAAGAAMVLSGFLFGVAPIDPLSLGTAGGVVLLVAACACYGPARRAITLDPAAVLRSE